MHGGPDVELYTGSHYRRDSARLDSDDVRELSSQLCSNSIRALSLQDATIDNQNIRRLFSSIGICRSLVSLNLSGGVLSSPERIESLCECLNINRGLTALFLQATPLDNSALPVLALAVKKHPTIRTLDLANCDLTDDAIRHVSNLLAGTRGMAGLEDLNLGSNPRITAQGWQLLAMAIADNSCLRALQLYYNNIGDHAACLLIIALSASKSLVSLDLESTNIGDQTAETLLHLLRNFPNHLREVNLSGNNIARPLQEKIKSQLSVFSALQAAPQSYLPPLVPKPGNSGPSAPYYYPSQSEMARPATVPEEEDDWEDEDTARSGNEEARNALRQQLQEQRPSTSQQSERPATYSPAEKPLSPGAPGAVHSNVSPRRVGTAKPGGRGPPETDRSFEDDDGDGMSSPVFMTEAHSYNRGGDSPYSDIIVSDGAAALAALDFGDTGLGDERPGSAPNRTAPILLMSVIPDPTPILADDGHTSPAFEAPKSPERVSRIEEEPESEEEEIAAKTPEAEPNLPESTELRPDQTITIHREASNGSAKSKPDNSRRSFSYETIPRDKLIPPDSSRIQVSKSYSFERSLQTRQNSQPSKPNSHQPSRESTQEDKKDSKPISRESTIENAYLPIAGGQMSKENSKSSSGKHSTPRDISFVTSPAFGVPLNGSQSEGAKKDTPSRRGSKNSLASEPTVATSYRGESPKVTKPHSPLAFGVEDRQLDDVLRQSQVPVSNRMLHHGMNSELKPGAKENSSGSIDSLPRSLKTVLTKSSSADQQPAAPGPGAAGTYREDSSQYLYADRAAREK